MVLGFKVQYHFSRPTNTQLERGMWLLVRIERREATIAMWRISRARFEFSQRYERVGVLVLHANKHYTGTYGNFGAHAMG